MAKKKTLQELWEDFQTKNNQTDLAYSQAKCKEAETRKAWRKWKKAKDAAPPGKDG